MLRKPLTRAILTALTFVLTAAAFTAAFNRLGPLPALAPFLNPHTGFWQNGTAPEPFAETVRLSHPQMKGHTEVRFDEIGIPHIFATNDHDLYFTQGYLTARDRLWQMDMQARAGSGRLAEALGPGLIGFDKGRRRMGMARAAEVRLEETLSDERSRTALEAYAAGVNTWIQSLEPEELPFEYKLLGFRPERWTPLHTSEIAMGMAYTLSGGSSDIGNSVARELFGPAFVEDFLWHEPENGQPVLSEEQLTPFQPLDPGPPPAPFKPSLVDGVSFDDDPEDPVDGSNNWVLSGERTASGFPILANDPHLAMRLPSTWYGVHLDGPEHSVMGVSIPGAPGVIIGFNRHIAWGVTNVGADVLDLYEIRFRTDEKREYLHGGEWKPVRFREERIAVRGGDPVVLEIPYTHHGPVAGLTGADESTVHHAIRWLAHDPANDSLSWYLFNRARNHDDFREALRHFRNPAQNFVFASREGDIALQMAGRFPLRAPGQGRFISDGSDPGHDWRGWIPEEHEPVVLNPPEGFLGSANQRPVPSSYPYELGDRFSGYERGLRLHERLAGATEVTVEDMRQLQLDTFSHHAATALPWMLARLDPEPLSGPEAEVYQILKNWNFHNDPEAIAPAAFEVWWRILYQRLFGDRIEKASMRPRLPRWDRAVDLMVQERLTGWFDDPATPETETPETVVTDTFREMFGKMTEAHGTFGKGWRWTAHNPTAIPHMAYLDGFGRENLATGGSGESLNAIDGSHGPSWRMVVEMGPEIRAYGIYPGGQSGHPASPDYDALVQPWAEGRLLPLSFPERSEVPEAESVLNLDPERPRLPLPGWSILLFAGIAGAALRKTGIGSFLLAGGAVAFYWFGLTAWHLQSHAGPLAHQTAHLLMMPSPWLLPVATAILGGLLAGLTAFSLSRILKHLGHR
jgi:penicillin amidase